MEASSTTLNISSPAAEPQPEAPKVTIGGNGAVMHSHGPNFGRWVADCPGCLKKYPEGPPKRGAVKRAKALHRLEKERIEASVTQAAVSANAAVDGLLNEIEQLKRKLATAQATPYTIPDSMQLPEERREEDPMKELVAIMLRKEAKTVQGEEEDEQRKKKNRAEMVAIEMQKIALTEANQAACGHVKENGRTAISGQVHNDGLYHPFCQRCFKTFTPVFPRGGNIQNGVMN